MPRIHFKFFTRSTEPHEPEIFVENLNRHFDNECLPKRFWRDDDELFDFDVHNLQRFVQFWWDGRFSWERGTQRASGWVYGHVGLGNWAIHTAISHSFRSTPSLEDRYADFLIATASALHADYAYAHLLPDDEAKVRPNDRRLDGAVALDLRRALPGVPWAACYGKPYIDLFGDSNLLTMPVRVVRKLSDEMIYCQLTEHICDTLERPEAVAAAQEGVFKRLGRNAFYDPDDPDNLDFHNIDRSTGKIVTPPWPDPITVPAVTSKKFWAGK